MSLLIKSLTGEFNTKSTDRPAPTRSVTELADEILRRVVTA